MTAATDQLVADGWVKVDGRDDLWIDPAPAWLEAQPVICRTAQALNRIHKRMGTVRVGVERRERKLPARRRWPAERFNLGRLYAWRVRLQELDKTVRPYRYGLPFEILRIEDPATCHGLTFRPDALGPFVADLSNVPALERQVPNATLCEQGCAPVKGYDPAAAAAAYKAAETVGEFRRLDSRDRGSAEDFAIGMGAAVPPTLADSVAAAKTLGMLGDEPPPDVDEEAAWARERRQADADLAAYADDDDDDDDAAPAVDPGDEAGGLYPDAADEDYT